MSLMHSVFENAESDAFGCFSYTLLNPFQAVKSGQAVFIFGMLNFSMTLSVYLRYLF